MCAGVRIDIKRDKIMLISQYVNVSAFVNGISRVRNKYTMGDPYTGEREIQHP